MDVTKFSALRRPSRREFLTGLAALGATTLLPTGFLPGQTPAGGGRRIIDVHQHFASPAYVALLNRKVEQGPQTADTATMRAVANRFRDYSAMVNLEAMDEGGVETAMVSPTAPAAWFGDAAEARQVAREMNEYAAERLVGDHPGRFGLFAVLPFPDVDGCLREIEYAFDTLGVRGVGLLTSYDDKWLGDEDFAPIFDELNRRNAIVYTHPREASCCPNLVGGVSAQTLEYPTDTTRTIMSLVAGGTADRCPNVSFIFSHAGGTLVSIAGRFLGNQVSADNLDGPVEPDSRLHHVRRFYYDTAGSANPVQLQSLKLLVPTSQIVFGTDFPFGNPAGTVAGVQSSGFSAQELDAIYRGNALRMLPEYA
jgi:predicted TIM-barrel fold metal-dependent hydrolase